MGGREGDGRERRGRRTRKRWEEEMEVARSLWLEKQETVARFFVRELERRQVHGEKNYLLFSEGGCYFCIFKSHEN